MFSGFDLTYFVTASESKTLADAAIKLGLSQPALTAAIQRLEDQLGFKVFARSKKGIMITPAGKTFLPKAKQLLFIWENAKRELEGFGPNTGGLIKLGAHASVAEYFFAPLLKKVISEFDGWDIEMVHDLSRKILSGVINGEIDLAAVINPVPHPDLILKQVASDEVGFWKSSTKYDPKNESVMTLIYDPNLLQSQEVLKKVKTLKEGKIRHIHTGNLDVVLRFVEQGLGIGILPGRVVKMSKEKLEPMTDWPHFKDRLFLACRFENKNHPVIQAIFDRIKEEVLD